MNGSQVSGGAAVGILAGFTAFLLIVALVVWILLIVAHWKMFTKAGEPGWKSIIPIYNDYVLFKLVWNPTQFFIYLGLAIVTSILNTINQGLEEPNIFLAILLLAAAIALFVWYIRLQLATAKAYGQGTGFAVGLILLPNIFTLILGFGSARYVGPQDA